MLILLAVRAMMYGYGDAQQPLPESVDFVEVLPLSLRHGRVVRWVWEMDV